MLEKPSIAVKELFLQYYVQAAILDACTVNTVYNNDLYGDDSKPEIGLGHE